MPERPEFDSGGLRAMTDLRKAWWMVMLSSFICLGGCVSNPSQEKPSGYNVVPPEQLQVSGCGVYPDSYAYAMQRALNFLVFSESFDSESELFQPGDDGIHYVRRHTRNVFQIVMDSKKGKGCMTPTLRRIAQELGFPEPSDSPDRIKKLRKVDADEPQGFEVLTRSEYINQTQCLVSPATYQKLQAAIYYGVLVPYPEKAQSAMRDFLRQVGEGRRDDQGNLDKTCMTAGIKALANHLNVLDQNGEIKLQ